MTKRVWTTNDDGTPSGWEEPEGGSQPVLPDTDESATQPAEGTMKTWATTDAINGTLVHFRSKGIYASLIDDEGFLAFVARTIGAVGNTFTVAYLKPGANAPLLVAVTGNAVSVQLATSGSDPVAATLTVTPGNLNADLVFAAKTGGVGGNAISVEYVDPEADTPDTVASASGDAITVALAGTAAVSAVCHDTDNKIDFTGAVRGAALNGHSLLLYEYSAYSWGVPFPGDFSLNFPAGDTVQDLLTWLAGHPGGGPNVTAALGAGGSLSDVLAGTAPFAFSGGVDGAISSTADDVKVAVDADGGSAALVAVALAPGNDGSGIVAAYGPQNLAGGAEAGEITSTASEVKDAIEEDTEAAALVSVILQSNSTMFAMGETNLSGGNDTTVLEGSVSLS